MFLRFLFLSAIGVILTLSFKIKVDRPEEVSYDQDFTEKKPLKRAQRELAKRNPASIQPHSSALPEGPAYTNTQRRDDDFGKVEELERPASEETRVVSGWSEGSNYPRSDSTFRRPRGPRGPSKNDSHSRSNGNSKNIESSSGSIPVIAGMNYFSPTAGGSGSNSDNDSASQDGSSGTSEAGESITCDASVGSGSYAYAFDVTLSCSSSSHIKYCLSENTCCDPETSGLSYSGPVTINPGAGTFCLSFVGVSSSSGRLSAVVEKSYTLNPDLPDLQIAVTKKYYQTTELEGLMSFTSADFGTRGFYAGVINLKNHDPGSSGLNWSCEEILSDHGTLSSPVTSMAMPDTDVSGYSPSSQVDLFLSPTTLVYGNNRLTTYVQNATFTEPVVSCSTNNIFLEDFPFFETLPYHGVTGTDDVREFSGGFTHLGYFEDETTVYTGSHGDGSEVVASQELETNLFPIFH